MRCLVSLSILLLLGGCFKPVRAPSLAPRPIEEEAVLAPAAQAEPEMPAPAVLLAELQRQVAAASAGDAAFSRAAGDAERAVSAARGAEPGSEAWIAAQQAVSALDAALAPSRDAAAAVDGLRQDPANAGSGARAAVEQAAARIATIQDREAGHLAALTRRLP